MFHPIEGGHAGHEDFFGGYAGQISGVMNMVERLGGYMVESNSGHIGDDIDPRAGDDPTLYGHRASIESARFSRFIAAQIYGREPDYGYVWGGSGGGRRSPLCLEYGPDVYDGALPYMGGGNIDKHGTTARVRSDQPIGFGCMFNVQRLLGDKLAGVIDAMQPGGGNPYDGLDAHQREELASLYRLGYPRGDEFMISQPMGQMWLWTSIADMLQKEDADYFQSFWAKPGYVGHDHPEHVADHLINATGTVSRIVTAKEFRDSPDFAGPEFANAKPFVILLASLMGHLDLPIGIEVKGIPQGYRLGTGVRMLSGAAKDRQLYCLNHGGDFFFCEGQGEANLKRFMDVRVGDEVRIDNRAFLAFCYYYRHHISGDSLYDFLRVDGKPLFPQHGVPLQSPLMGVPYSGQYEGKLMWVHHTHDASLWPPQGLFYKQAVEQAQGPVAAARKFRLRWTENAEHVPPAVTAVATQAITKNYYGTDTLHRYMSGCSGGGRMATESITRHPDDFDGVLLGAAGGRSSATMMAFIHNAQQMNREPGAWLSPQKLQMLEQKVTAQCDGLDGAKDDIIADHRACSFDFDALRCPAGDQPGCLTEPELKSVKAVLAGPHGPQGQITLGYPMANISFWSDYLGHVPPPWSDEPTMENMPKTSTGYVIGSSMAKVLFGPDFNVLTDFDFNDQQHIDRWWREVDKIGYGKPNSADLRGLQKSGGKVLMWNGVSDPCCSDVELEGYYREAGEIAGGMDKLQEFAEFYRVPGLGHCVGGVGPQDAVDQFLDAMIGWVEHGTAPGALVAHRGDARLELIFANPGSGKLEVAQVAPSPGEPRDFLLCPYPQVAVFDKAAASEDKRAVFDARNWQCHTS